MTSSNSVPFQETSDEIWDKKYRLKTFEGIALENSREDTFWRVAKALASVEKEAVREDWQKKFYWALLNGATPGGRILANAGAEEYKPRTSLINCLAGETRVLIKDKGLVPICEIVGKEVFVLNANKNWSKVIFKSYGNQDLYGINFRYADKKNITTVWATKNHRWILENGRIITTEYWLTGGKVSGHTKIKNCLPEFTIKKNLDFLEGLLHGAVYGDGSRYVYPNYINYVLPLIGSKIELQEYLDIIIDQKAHNLSLQNKEAIKYNKIRRSANLKQLPNDVNNDYLQGFFAGIIATDGSVVNTKGESAKIKIEGNEQLIKFLESKANLLGIAVMVVRKCANKGDFTNYGKRNNDLWQISFQSGTFNKELFLRSDQKELFKVSENALARSTVWSYVGNSNIIRKNEEVFCCEELETQSFVIENGLLTGNCVLSKKIEDSIEGIGQALKEAGVTLSTGSGIGYNFSTLRPKGAFINGVGAITSGALSYMDVFDALCKTISSAGGRRGAQMGVLHDWHPDLEDFIKAKREDGRLRHFNLSIAISNDFMKAVKQDEDWDLVFPIKRREFSFYVLKEGVLLKDPYKIVLQNIKNPEEEIFCKWCAVEYSDNTNELLFNDEKRVLCKVYKTVKARYLWDLIMRSAYEYSEPGILFLERINDDNPLWFAEDLIATNPCGEVPLPQYGACLLGSVNLTKFVENPFTDIATFNWEHFASVIKIFCRMLDNVVEVNGLPLVEQQQEILRKRRHGMGVYGLGSALCMLRMHMGTIQALNFTDDILRTIQEIGIAVGIELAKEKGPAPVFEERTLVDEAFLIKAKKHLDDATYSELLGYKNLEISNKDLYQYSKYVTDQQHRTDICVYGLRYSHHTSIAPTGTMSLAIGNNVDSGIEPAFSHSYIRNVTEQGRNTRRPVEVMSYEYLAYKTLIDKDITIDKLPDYFVSSDTLTWKQHLDIQCVAQKYVDQSISKTINLPTEIPFEEFKEVYQYAFDNGAKGTTVYRYNPETLQGVLQTKKDLDNTFYNINFENGEVLTLSGSTSIEYEGEVTSVASLYDSLKEGMYGKW